MKTLAVIGLLVVGTSLQAFSMGHPHNVFTAHKHMRTRTTASIKPIKATAPAGWQNLVQVTKTLFSELVIAAFSQVSPVHSF